MRGIKVLKKRRKACRQAMRAQQAIYQAYDFASDAAIEAMDQMVRLEEAIHDLNKKIVKYEKEIGDARTS